MTAKIDPDSLRDLARAYCSWEDCCVDTVEITAFVEWYYQQCGKNIERGEVMAYIEGKK